MDTEKQPSFPMERRNAVLPASRLQRGLLFLDAVFRVALPLWVSVWSKDFCRSDTTLCSLTYLCCLLPGPRSSPARVSAPPPGPAHGSFTWRSGCLQCVCFIFCAHLLIKLLEDKFFFSGFFHC